VIASQLRIGISGWRYEPWRGVFYPEGLPQKSELEYAARHFNSIEINGSFYSLQRPSLYQRWHDATPDDFVFAVKGGRFITHMKKLIDVRTALANFLASGVLCLERKLGPILWQFPESLPCDLERFAAFFELLPRDTQTAAELAREHSPRLADRVATRVEQNRPLRHAVEVRSASCVEPAFIELLRAHGLACVVADTAGKWPMIEAPTASFTYVRLHGGKRLYVSGYGPRAIAAWAERVARWRARGDVYVYFDNDAKVHAPFDAAALAKALEVTIGEPLRNKRGKLARRRPLREAIRGG
jgi:uncharacterized protein YecE (DUF72 family)